MTFQLRSLRGRLTALLLLLVAATTAAGLLMVDLFRQSATAQAGRAEAEIARACDAIADRYRFFATGWEGSPQLDSAALQHDLTAVVQTALRDRVGVEGGIWRAGAGSFAYAYPTYEGGGPKTDVPQAELPRIEAVNRAALAEERQVSARYDASTQILLLTACPLSGPIPALTGWTMTRVSTFAGRGYRQLMAGLGVLFAAFLAAAALLGWLTMTWSRHVSRIERTLQAHDIADLPSLPPTGERELDRIVTALNEAGRRIAAARQRADQLTRQVATSERLAAIGRVSAGLAHEIRNPIAAMRLRAENAVAGDAERKRQALSIILEQIARLDAIVQRLLTVTERGEPHREFVGLASFLENCVSSHIELARAKQIALECRADETAGYFDPDQMRGALDNLVLNAIEAAPTGSSILIAARRDSGNLVLSVQDEGAGPPRRIRDTLFEPFVTGRADGTGLGLSIVREVAAGHGGTAQLVDLPAGTIFEIIVPWQ